MLYRHANELAVVVLWGAMEMVAIASVSNIVQDRGVAVLCLSPQRH